MTVANENHDKWLKPQEAAKYLGVSGKTLMRMNIPHLEIKNKSRTMRRYKKSVIEEFEQRHMVTG